MPESPSEEGGAVATALATRPKRIATRLALESFFLAFHSAAPSGGRSRSVHVAGLPPQHQHDLAREHLRRGLLPRGTRVVDQHHQPLLLRHPSSHRTRTTGAVQPQAPRRRRGLRLPLLPHLGRDLGIRGDPAHQDVHELPFPNLGQTARCSSRCARASRRGSRSSGRACTTCRSSSTSTTAFT